MSALERLRTVVAGNDNMSWAVVKHYDLALAIAVIEAANDLQGAVPGSQYRKCSRDLILALAALTKTEE